MKTYWAIKDGRIILPFTIRTTRGQCLEDFTLSRLPYTWTDLERQGKRVIKVTVKECK
jgi:hypothetical protein